MQIENISGSPRYIDGDIEKFRGCLSSAMHTYDPNKLPGWLKDE
jgi:hypothetical protein